MTQQNIKIAVLGLGYVGLPLAKAFANHYPVTGYDINETLISQLTNCHIDKLPHSKPLNFTTKEESLESCTVYIIAVPTPVDDSNKPNLTALLSATKTVAKYLKKGDYVIYESTVYPGCTEEECIPLLEQGSSTITREDPSPLLAGGIQGGTLAYKTDFKVGFSPERINPGDQEHTLENTVKVTAGCDEESSAFIAALYSKVVKAGVHPVSSIKVAETAKIIENTQRDLNIALMNELSIICNRMGVNTYEALEAAGTKWNFLKFSPGLVGGHCIGVDPYYLTYKATKLGYHPHVILSGRYVNDSMGFYIAKQTVKKLLDQGKNPAECKVLVMGFTFKEDVGDIRNTRVADLVKELKSYKVQVGVVDPVADAEEVLAEYGISLQPSPPAPLLLEMGDTKALYDTVVLAVAHREYRGLSLEDFKRILAPDGLFVDVKGIFRELEGAFAYWSL